MDSKVGSFHLSDIDRDGASRVVGTRPMQRDWLATPEPFDERHFVADIIVPHLIDHALTDQEAEAAGTRPSFSRTSRCVNGSPATAAWGSSAVETRALVAEPRFPDGRRRCDR